MFDTVIRNATLYGLEGNRSAAADLGIKDGRIAKIGAIPEKGAMEVDGRGYCALPGFVDVHSHSDYYLFIDPAAEGKLRQGVTSEVGGNCGYSAAPIGGDILRVRSEAYKEQFGLTLDWKDFNEYWQRLEKKNSSVNYAGLIGYNTLRASVLGSKDVPAAGGGKETMKRMIRENMAQGAAGMSVGLVYPPACFATKEEMVEMVGEVAKAGKLFTTHIRSEGPRLVESIDEVIEIARRTGVKLQISHLKTAGKDNWHKLDTVFNMIETARANGVDIECDRYPYTASNTGLQVVLPDWAFDGGRDGTLDFLKDPAARNKMRAEILANHPEPEYWDTVMVSQVATPKNYGMQGLTVARGAAVTGKDPVDFVFDILLEEKTEVEAIYFCMNQGNMDRILAKEYVMVGSDAGARSVGGPLGIGRPHPRTFGTFPRFFAEYVFGRKLVTMEEAVMKTSTAASRRFGLAQRGELREGYWADIVMIRPETIADTTTYEDPLSYPKGVDYVFVNGVLSINKGEYTGALAGRGLKIH